MTSTSFNVGLQDKKSSSRVLKPPGGGHTDIFGINSDAISTPSKRNHIPPTTITSCFSHEEVNSQTHTDSETNGKNTENGHQNNKPDENTEPSIDENKEEEQKKCVEPPRRVRVPPGGFSSGLW